MTQVYYRTPAFGCMVSNSENAREKALWDITSDMSRPLQLALVMRMADGRGVGHRVFAALDGPPLRVLEKYPLDVLELERGLPSGWDGGYFPSERWITVREIGVPTKPRRSS